MRQVSKELEDKALLHAKKMRNFKTFLNFQKINNLDVKDPGTFLNAKRVLTVVRAGMTGQQIWVMVAEPIDVFGIFPLLAFFDNDSVNKLKLYYSVRFPLLSPLPIWRFKANFPFGY